MKENDRSRPEAQPAAHASPREPDPMFDCPECGAENEECGHMQGDPDGSDVEALLRSYRSDLLGRSGLPSDTPQAVQEALKEASLLARIDKALDALRSAAATPTRPRCACGRFMRVVEKAPGGESGDVVACAACDDQQQRKRVRE